MTPGVPRAADVVIVGGGVIGTSVAFHLAEAGVPSLLLERDTLAAGSTSRSAGGVRAQFSDEVNIRLGARGLELFEDFADRPGAEIDLKQVGYLFLHSDPVSWEAAQEAVMRQNDLGVRARLLTAGEAARMSPGIVADDLLGATFHGRDGYCSPENVVQGYAAAARRLGATIRTGVAVTGLERTSDGITAVTTSAGTVRTRTVVCAAGAWSAELGEWAGVPLPVTPVRRQIVVTEPLPDAVLDRFGSATPMTIDAASTFYFHREGPGLLIGMSDPRQEPGFRPGYTEDWLPALHEAMARRAPALLDVGIAHRWWGYYERSPDDNGLVGRAAACPGFLYATGFSGHGFLQAPAVGEVIRDLYLGCEPTVDVTALSADRFRGFAPVTERAIV